MVAVFAKKEALRNGTARLVTSMHLLRENYA
jgi:hypothetical protein